MKTNDIGVLFDVSGSMQSPFNSLSYNNSSKKSDELLNIIEKICSRGNRLKNEKIRMFSIIFGGKNEPIFDFCNLLEISNKKFVHTLSSDPHQKASKYGYAQRLTEILSEHGSKTLKLDNYLYCDSGPSERLCELGYYLLENDHYLRREIYDSLPKQCKSTFQNFGVSTVNFFGGYQKEINESTVDVINNIYRTCIKKYISSIISEEISQRKANVNKFKILDCNDLINMKKNLEGKLASPEKSKINILDLFSNYIYGNTPLYTSLNYAFNNFQIQSNGNYKYLIIISDGELNDIQKNFDYIGEIRKKAEDNQVMIISIFLTNNSIPKEEKLYDKIESHFSQGSKDLFLMSSTLTYEHPIIKFFIQKGWDVPISGECKLFVEVNNSKNLNKFIDLFNEAIGEINNRNNREIPQNPNSLINLLSSTVINDYMNSEINNFESKKQEGGTCYANAIAANICLASSRVYGREKLNFFDVRKKIIDKYGTHGGNTFQICKEYLINYRLHSQIVDEEGARKAVMKTRPCVARFNLTAQQWGNFSKFYRENKKGILTKEILNDTKNIYPDSTPGGHAVVLTHISKDYLTFLNSWGPNFADNGYFRVKNADVLGMQFCDIFWYISDLSKEEIDAYNEHIQKLKKDIDKFIYD